MRPPTSRTRSLAQPPPIARGKLDGARLWTEVQTAHSSPYRQTGFDRWLYVGAGGTSLGPVFPTALTNSCYTRRMIGTSDSRQTSPAEGQVHLFRSTKSTGNNAISQCSINAQWEAQGCTHKALAQAPGTRQLLALGPLTIVWLPHARSTRDSLCHSFINFGEFINSAQFSTRA